MIGANFATAMCKALHPPEVYTGKGVSNSVWKLDLRKKLWKMAGSLADTNLKKCEFIYEKICEQLKGLRGMFGTVIVGVLGEVFGMVIVDVLRCFGVAEMLMRGKG